MDHGMHSNSALHWSYGTPVMATPPQNHWTPPPQSHSLKRAMSESDCEDLYSEESSKEQISPSNGGSCQMMSRKKRRGVIEKKRRDRINSSLSELKRLVPTAYEKQGSAKLEKAEILQLTVEHLKNLQSKGMDAVNYDPQRFAMDYHIIGFRECAAEVARYLVTIEGMDIQDPLRLRLMSHLQYFVQQRELSSPSSWTASPCSGVYQPNCPTSPYQTYPASPASHLTVSSSAYVPNLPTPVQPYPTLGSTGAAAVHHQQPSQQQQQTTTASSHISATTAAASNETMPILSHNATQQQQQQQHSTQQHSTQQHASQQHATQQHSSQQQHAAQQQHTAQQQQHSTQHQSLSPSVQQESHHHQAQPQPQHYTQDHTQQENAGATYIELTNSQTHTSLRNATPSSSSDGSLTYGNTAQYPVGVPPEYNPNASLNYVSSNGSKPYRPWGAEMAY